MGRGAIVTFPSIDRVPFPSIRLSSSFEFSGFSFSDSFFVSLLSMTRRSGVALSAWEEADDRPAFLISGELSGCSGLHSSD